MCFPGCWKLLICDEFTILFTEFHQAGTILISSASWHCPIQFLGPDFLPNLLLKSAASIVMDDGALSNSLRTLSRFLYSFLISFGHFLAWSEVGAYTFMMLMIFFGFILILLTLILNFSVGLHSDCGPSAQVSGLPDNWRTQILSDSLQYLWINSCHFFGTTNPLP